MGRLLFPKNTDPLRCYMEVKQVFSKPQLVDACSKFFDVTYKEIAKTHKRTRVVFVFLSRYVFTDWKNTFVDTETNVYQNALERESALKAVLRKCSTQNGNHMFVVIEGEVMFEKCYFPVLLSKPPSEYSGNMVQAFHVLDGHPWCAGLSFLQNQDDNAL